MHPRNQQTFPIKIFPATVTLSNGHGSAQWDHVGTVGRVPFEDYDEILFAPYMKQQNLALLGLLELVPSLQPGGLVCERYEVREVGTGDVLCLWRVPIFCGQQALQIDSSGLFAFSGEGEHNGKDIQIFYNSIRRGLEERGTGVIRAYWGKIYFTPLQDSATPPDGQAERCVERVMEVVSSFPTGYSPGGRVEIIGARDPKTGEHQMMVQVPALSSGTRTGKPRRRGRRGQPGG